MTNNNKIQVFGSGCPTCKKLHEITLTAIKDLGIESDVEYITDIQKIVEMGLITTPVLTVNGKAVMVGFSPDIEKIKDLITKNLE